MRKNLKPIDIIIKNLSAENIQLLIQISSRIIFSEILPCDLKYERKELTTIQWYNLIKNLFEGICEMHTKLHIFHSQLHLGNVLIYIVNDSYIQVIHDLVNP